MRKDGQTDGQSFFAILQTRPKILRSAHAVCLCFLYGSQNKQRLFPYTTLADWFV